MAQKEGFYSSDEITKVITNLTGRYKMYSAQGKSLGGNSAITVFNRKPDADYDDSKQKQVVFYGGMYGSLTASAQVLSFAENYCMNLRKTNKYDHLFESFKFVFLPIANGPAYEEAYKLKNSSSKDSPVTSNSEETKEGIQQVFVDSENTVLLISIQGIGSDIVGGRKDSVELTEEQRYAYKRLYDNKKYKSPDSNSGSLFNYVLGKEKYIVQYEHEAKKKLVREDLDEEFKEEFTELFDRLNSALAKPKIVFDKARENRDPTKKKPSTITFYLNVTNNYFFQLEGNLVFNITVNYEDKERRLEFIRVEESYLKLYDDEDEISNVEGSVGEANITSSEDENIYYQVTLSNFVFGSFTKHIFKIKFERTIGGRIKFDTDTKLEAESYYFSTVTSKSRGDFVSLKEDSDDTADAPKQVVLFIMMLLFLLIILVIVCVFLVNSKSNKLIP